jgi:hypothetical protein
LIVVGHKHRTRLARWWSESDEESLLERIRCSILVAVAVSDEAGARPPRRRPGTRSFPPAPSA